MKRIIVEAVAQLFYTAAEIVFAAALCLVGAVAVATSPHQAELLGLMQNIGFGGVVVMLGLSLGLTVGGFIARWLVTQLITLVPLWTGR